MDNALLDQLRADLEHARYRLDAVRTLLGHMADDARQRGSYEPSRRVLAERVNDAPEWQQGCATLTRLFMLGDTVSMLEASECFAQLSVQGALDLGLLESADVGRVRAALSLNPVFLPDTSAADSTQHTNWWVISDLDDHLRNSPARSDHVMGVGGATRTLLAQVALPSPDGVQSVSSALDLGTGCGIIALVLAGSGIERVVATDISPRALAFAAANARLNGIDDGHIDFRLGSLFEPVAGEQFDLVLSNPPFVITPRDTDGLLTYEYRDAGLHADDLARTVIIEGPGYLAPAGTLCCLANWEQPWGGSGLDRVRGWLEAAAQRSGPFGAWVIERDTLDPEHYAETWVRDGGTRPSDAQFDRLVGAWLDDFADRQTVQVGLGSVRVIRAATLSPRPSVIRTEHASQPFAHSPAAALHRTMLAGIEVEYLTDQQLLDTYLVRSDAVHEQREYRPGQQDPRSISLTVTEPIERTVRADTLLAAALGACDGELCLQQISDALATLLDLDPSATSAALIESVRELVWLGMLAPAER